MVCKIVVFFYKKPQFFPTLSQLYPTNIYNHYSSHIFSFKFYHSMQIVKLLVMTNRKTNVFQIDNAQYVKSGAIYTCGSIK